uniref:Enhancer of mRNA-decapping protein 4 WD40 repeat region domain-containing protein n=2 Tax=Trichobilharzia regenti TaxID=157069 RepID=A0AA85J7Q4_TRIRE|nr:unnamed protein product [Trichobilharzia regenti]
MWGKQELYFTGEDEDNLRDIFSSFVDIYPSAKSSLDAADISASSKISLKPAVKYFWDYQYYVTRLISRHHASSLIAYAIRHVKKSDSEDETHLGMVRLLNIETGQKLLLRSFADRIIYMDFAIRQEALLAVLDYSGALNIFHIDQGTVSSDPMTSSFYFSLRPPENFVPIDVASLTWCPWVSGSKAAVLCTPENYGNAYKLSKDPSLLIAFSVHHKVKVLDVGLVVSLLQKHLPQDIQSSEPITWNESEILDCAKKCTIESVYYAEMSNHSDAITAITLSRDGSCLASGSLDGQVCIYSLVNRISGDASIILRPIHVFRPHDGLPVYSVIFLDNILRNDESSTWSHLLTGAQSNREIRLWSCLDWSCLQTVRFCPGALNTDPLKQANMPLLKPGLLLALDSTASFLIAADVTRRVLYTLEIGSVETTAENLTELEDGISAASSCRKMGIVSVGEFLLTSPCLLFALGSFSRKTGIDLVSAFNGRNGSQKVVMDQICVDIHIVHSRNLLNGTIQFELPHRSKSAMLDVINSIIQSSSSVKSSLSHHTNNNDNDDNSPKLDSDLNVTSEGNEVDKVSHNTNANDENVVTSQQSDQDSLMSDNHQPETESVNIVSEYPLSAAVNDNNSVNSDTVSFTSIETPSTENFQGAFPDASLTVNHELSKTSKESGCEDVNHGTTSYQSPLAETPTSMTPPIPSLPIQELLYESLKKFSCTKTDTNIENHLDSTDENNIHTLLPDLKMSGGESPPQVSSSLMCVSEYKIQTREVNKNASSPAALQNLSVSTSNINDDHLLFGHDQLRKDSDDTKTSFSSTVEHMDHMTSAPDYRMDIILNQLKELTTTSREQNNKFEYIIEQFHETKLKLEEVQQRQYEIIEQLNNRGQILPSSKVMIPGVKQKHLGDKSVEMANQILLQLRTIQGDFSRRYSQLDDSMNKVLSSVQDPRFPNTHHLHNIESRISVLPKLLCDSLKSLLRDELQRTISHNILNITEPLRETLHRAIQESLSTLTSNLAENVQRTLRDKNFSAQIVRSISGPLTNELSSSYRDSLNKIFVPALEKGIKMLFTDINEVFQTGTQQYLNQISSTKEIPFDYSKFTASLTNQITSVIKSTVSSAVKDSGISCISTENVTNTGRAKSNQPGDTHSDTNSSSCLANKSTSSTLLDRTHSSVNKSYNRNLNKSGTTSTVNATSSNVITSSKNKIYSGNEVIQEPQSSSLVKQDELARLIGQAQMLIRSNRLVQALELALVSTNQSLLLDVCSDIDVNQLFGSGDHKIGQNVLLSLIHQLSCGDFTTQLDLKIRYLQEAILCLEPNDPTTSAHGPAILNLLTVRLEALLSSSHNCLKGNTKTTASYAVALSN